MNGKRLLILITVVITAIGALCAALVLNHVICIHHEWYKTGCTEAMKCKYCGVSNNIQAGHRWLDATCTEASKCSDCGEQQGTAKGHNWTAVSCTKDSVCKVCGEKGEVATGHSWTEATCTEASVCSVCGEKGEAAAGHSWSVADCTESAVCSVCGEQREPAEHSWTAPTCTEASVCAVCGVEGEEALGHQLPEGADCTSTVYCVVCSVEITDGRAHSFCDSDGKWHLDCLKCGLRDTAALYSQVNAGDRMFFGSYEQDNNTENGKESIEWIVLEKKDNRIFVLSKYALDTEKYNTLYGYYTWENCSLRQWLNNEFINAAFSSEEQAMIPSVLVTAGDNPAYVVDAGNDTNDRVFLLSYGEAAEYFPEMNDRLCVPTAYALAHGTATEAEFRSEGKATCWWWLRSPGNYTYNGGTILNEGSLYAHGLNVQSYGGGVRPVVWIDMSA